ncbi:MAG: hypothetical protein LW878_05105 [Proteobacteria bacterium]|nr:hypothetical protein [Pseudomonadota bacterium]
MKTINPVSLLAILCVSSTSALALSPLTQSVRSLVGELKQQEGCQLSEAQREAILKKAQVLKKKGKNARLVLEEIKVDIQAVNCPQQTTLEATKQEILAQSATFPLNVFGLPENKSFENLQDQSALVYFQSLESKSCPVMDQSQRFSFADWHEVLLTGGWPCTVKNYKRLAEERNQSRGFSFKERQRELEVLDLKETKDLFRKTFANERLLITFVPQLGWESGVVNTTFPYTLITDKTELTSYRFLTREFRRLGMRTKVVSRNSVAPMNDQVQEARGQLENADEKQIVISRSMGSRVVREYIARYSDEARENLRAWFNVGGTPHGSFIASYKSQKDNFYLGHLPQILEAFKAPLSLIARDPRIPDHLVDTVLDGHRRTSLATLAAVAPQPLDTEIPVFNAVFMRDDYQRATSGVDPVWRDMLLYGPSEGSAPLNGAAVEAARSLELIEEGDHLSFWKMSPRDALKLYLRYLILAREQGLI